MQQLKLVTALVALISSTACSQEERRQATEELPVYAMQWEAIEFLTDSRVPPPLNANEESIIESEILNYNGQEGLIFDNSRKALFVSQWHVGSSSDRVSEIGYISEGHIVDPNAVLTRAAVKFSVANAGNHWKSASFESNGKAYAFFWYRSSDSEIWTAKSLPVEMKLVARASIDDSFDDLLWKSPHDDAMKVLRLLPDGTAQIAQLPHGTDAVLGGVANQYEPVVTIDRLGNLLEHHLQASNGWEPVNIGQSEGKPPRNLEDSVLWTAGQSGKWVTVRQADTLHLAERLSCSVHTEVEHVSTGHISRYDGPTTPDALYVFDHWSIVGSNDFYGQTFLFYRANPLRHEWSTVDIEISLLSSDPVEHEGSIYFYVGSEFSDSEHSELFRLNPDKSIEKLKLNVNGFSVLKVAEDEMQLLQLRATTRLE